MWNDEQIASAFVVLADDCGYVGPSEIMYFIKGMRDDMQARIDELEAIIKYIDDNAPLADDECVAPGITLSQAAANALKGC